MSNAVEGKLQERASEKRIFALDAMRGLAAFVVIWYHFRLMFTTAAPIWYLKPIFAGHQAVVLFFVLSGYVLSLPYWKGRQLPYGPYLVRRIFRIYAPYAAALLLSAAVASFFLHRQLPLSPWFFQTWHTDLTRGLFLRQALMTGGPELNTAFWSLRYEMQMSIIFPALCWLLLRLGVAGALSFGCVVAAAGLQWRSASLIWATCFIFGAILAWKRDTVARVYSRIPTVLKLAALALSIAAYFSDNNLVTMLGACGALIFAQHSRAKRWMDTAVPEYLGRVSYSMYLVHGTVLYGVIILLYGRLPVPAIVVTFLIATFVFSHLFCVLIEEPATQLGRRLTRKRDAGALVQRTLGG